MAYVTNDEADAIEDQVLADPAGWIRSQWSRFVALGPAIIDLQHRAAVVSHEALLAGDVDRAEAAKIVIRDLGKLGQLHQRAVDGILSARETLGLGQVTAVALATGFAALALLVAWIMRRYELQERIVEDLEAGVITAGEAQDLMDQMGAAPEGVLGAGTSLLKWVVLAFLGWLALEAWRARPRTNPPLALLRNPPPRLLGEEVYAVEYRHAEDGQDYRHDFRPGVRMEVDEDGSAVLYNPDRPIWREL